MQLRTPFYDPAKGQYCMPDANGYVSLDQMRAEIDVLVRMNAQRGCRAESHTSATLTRTRDITQNPQPTAPTSQKRPRLGWTVDENSRHFATAIHEAGHAIAVLLTRQAELESARIDVDGSGKVQFKTFATDRLDNEFISLAGWASTELVGLSDCNPERDLRDAGLSYRSQPQYVDKLRGDISRELAPHRAFIRCLAEKLYLSCPEPVSGAAIKEAWQRYRAGARCKVAVLFE